MKKSSLFKFIDLPKHFDQRGSLIALESNKEIPFDIERVYYIFDNKSDVPRGFHAHKHLKQVAICLHGSCKFTLDDGLSREEYIIKNNHQGILIEEMIWREMSDFEDGTIVLVLASEAYSEKDYIRDYDEFLTLTSSYD